MRIDISTQNPSAELAKVVVSVFPGHPERELVTIDIEVLSFVRDSIALRVDDKNARFIALRQDGALKSPYENSGGALPKYLGSEYGHIEDFLHRDKTGDDNHFVIHTDTQVTDVVSSDGWNECRLLFEPLRDPSELARETSRDVLVAKTRTAERVRGTYVLGGWARIIRDGSKGLEDGVVDRLELDVRMDRIKCGGLYLWLFGPRHHQFESASCEVSEDDTSDSRRVFWEKIRSPEFAEFPMWDGWIIGKEGTRNSKRFTCENQLTVDLRVRMTSHYLRLKARRRSFTTGVGLALAASLFLNASWTLVDATSSEGRLLIYWLLGLSCALFALLVARGYREP